MPDMNENAETQQEYFGRKKPEDNKTIMELKNKISSLEGELATRIEYDEYYRDSAKNIIAQFWCWYNSGNHKRDLAYKLEGLKYADDFFNDLLKELGGIE